MGDPVEAEAKTTTTNMDGAATFSTTSLIQQRSNCRG